MTRNVKILTAAVVVVATAAVVVYALFDPLSPWFPQCLFRQLTGYDCPGCGSQRALHALLTGHPLDALRYNVMVFVLGPVALAAALVDIFPRRFSRLRAVVHDSRFIAAIAVVTVVWWVARNVLKV